MSDTKTLTTIPLDAVVNIAISGQFLVDLQQGLMHLYELNPYGNMDEAFKSIAELKDREPKNKWEAHVFLYFVLIKEIETAFKNAGLTNERTQEELEKMIKERQSSTDSPESSPES